MPRRCTSGSPFKYPWVVIWTDASGKPRRKVFVWRGRADEEVRYLRSRFPDAHVEKTT